MGKSKNAAKVVEPGVRDDQKSQQQQELPYVCVHCSTPCAVLYRRLSVSLSSIKAMTCVNCEKLVDPYIEQEWLLVAIDCILLREEAYRHVLYNVDELKQFSVRTRFQLLFGWCILDGYLKWESITSDESPYKDGGVLSQHDQMFQLAVLSVTSSLGLLFQWYIMQVFQTRREKSRGAGTKLFWALILPSSFSIVTIFVNIWENAKTVRMLGSLLIAYWQGIAVWVVTGDLSTPLLGVVAGILWRLLVSLLFTQPFPCIGLELEILGENHHLCVT
jgi:hypothetical protein